MDGEKVCQKCSLSINFKACLYTVCEGECAGFFHASCVGLSEDALCVLSSINIIWMCDECLSQFRRLRDGIHCHPDNDATNVKAVGDEVKLLKKVKAVADEVKLLKKVVAGIQHTLSSIVKETSKNDKSPLHSTPISISSRQLFNGTDACALNAESDDHRSAVNDDEFS